MSHKKIYLDYPINQENNAVASLRPRNTLSRNGNMDENGPRDAVKQAMRQRSALGNLTNAQKQSSSTTSSVPQVEPPTKVTRFNSPGEIETMSRLPTDPDFEPLGVAERLFESSIGPIPPSSSINYGIPDSPSLPELENELPFEIPLRFLEEEQEEE